jgi:iron complex outermembrane recepter protein
MNFGQVSWCATTALGLVLAAVCAPSDRAWGQQGGGEAIDLTEIVVTARKRDERLLEVPITVSVATAELLQAAQVRNGFDLAALTPGLSYETTGSAANTKPVIRGVTTNSTAATQQKNSTFIDGVFVWGANAPPPFIDIERVEVLKGPQSTAYGRATFAGAINYVTKDPGQELAGRLAATAATGNEYEIGGVLGGGLGPAFMRGQIAAFFRTWDGNDEWVNRDGTKLGWEEQTYVSGKLLLDPNDAIQVKLRYTYSENRAGPNPFTYLDPGASSAANPGQRTTRFTRPDGTFTFYPTGAVPFTTRPYAEDFSTIQSPGSRVRKHRVSGEINVELLGEHSLTLVAAYNSEATIDWNGDPTNRQCWRPGASTSSFTTISCALSDQKYKDTQVDLRFASPGDSPLQYLLGGSYTDLESDWLIYQPVNGATFASLPSEDIVNWSVYGSASYRFLERVRLGFEGRYSIDETNFTGYGVCGLPAGSVARAPGVPCTASFRGSATPVQIADPFTGQTFATDIAGKTFKRFLYRGTIDVKLNDAWMVYGLVSRGNQPGRFNLGLPPAFDRFRVIEEELLDNYEIGIKGSFWGGRAKVTLAAFQMDWTNQTFRRTIQLLVRADGTVTEFDSTQPIPPGATTTLNTLIFNAGKSKVQGFELEAAAQPFAGLDVRGTLAYTRARFKEFCSEFLYQITGVETIPGGRCASVAGNALDGQPEWTGSASIGYSRPFGAADWSWFARADYFYQGKKYESEMNLAFVKANSTINLRGGIQSDRYSIELYGTNLSDNDVPTRANRLVDGTIPLASVGSTVTTPPARAGVSNQNNIAYVPRKERQFGVRMGVKF